MRYSISYCNQLSISLKASVENVDSGLQQTEEIRQVMSQLYGHVTANKSLLKIF